MIPNDLVERLEVHMSKTEEAGMYTTTNALFWAKEEIQRLRNLILDIGSSIDEQKRNKIIAEEYRKLING